MRFLTTHPKSLQQVMLYGETGKREVSCSDPWTISGGFFHHKEAAAQILLWVFFNLFNTLF